MTVAEEAREAVRERPFLLEALRAGVVNYTAAARHLDVGDEEAVATALRRFADDLSEPSTESRDARVTMESGLGVTTGSSGNDGSVLTVGDAALVPGEGSLTGVLATGTVDPAALAWVLDRLLADGVSVETAGVAGDALLVAVERRDGATALRIVEGALETVPGRE